MISRANWYGSVIVEWQTPFMAWTSVWNRTVIGWSEACSVRIGLRLYRCYMISRSKDLGHTLAEEGFMYRVSQRTVPLDSRNWPHIDDHTPYNDIGTYTYHIQICLWIHFMQFLDQTFYNKWEKICNTCLMIYEAEGRAFHDNF